MEGLVDPPSGCCAAASERINQPGEFSLWK